MTTPTNSIGMKIPKSVEYLVLAAAIALVVVGVLVFDRSENDAADPQALALDSPTSLYEAKTAPQTNEITSNTDLKVNQPSTSDDEDDSPPVPQRPIPAPYEKGVIHLGPGASLGGFQVFPEDDPWNQRIDDRPVDPLSQVLIDRIGREKPLYGDFGSGYWNDAPMGIPYVVVDGNVEPKPVRYTAYGDESDPGPYPLPPDAPIEGDPNVDGDRHVIVIDRDQLKLYELFRAFPIASGQLWRAESGAIFSLKTNTQRPIGWTSADAAGLPIFPGLVRYDEAVEQGEIKHALRFTVQRTRKAYVPPASHWASKHKDLDLPPMGMRVRLKNDFDISPFPPEVQVILTALKRYGMILADNGSDWFISGAPDPRWNDENLRTLKKLKGSDLEVILMEDLVEEE
ncbi:hypothetical protein SH668x_001135 [Planctomicrobium sp. SH668]|uniref:hypothetical protein n=1 Tax=Planctomicrobium sp. SH668 TaxID=3448126 RepID=UPI003F5C05BC